MFLANGTFWRVGLMSEEGVWIHSAEVPDSAAFSRTEEVGTENSCPHPALPGCGYHFHK